MLAHQIAMLLASLLMNAQSQYVVVVHQTELMVTFQLGQLSQHGQATPWQLSYFLLHHDATLTVVLT